MPLENRVKDRSGNVKIMTYGQMNNGALCWTGNLPKTSNNKNINKVKLLRERYVFAVVHFS